MAKLHESLHLPSLQRSLETVCAASASQQGILLVCDCPCAFSATKCGSYTKTHMVDLVQRRREVAKKAEEKRKKENSGGDMPSVPSDEPTQLDFAAALSQDYSQDSMNRLQGNTISVGSTVWFRVPPAACKTPHLSKERQEGELSTGETKREFGFRRSSAVGILAFKFGEGMSDAPSPASHVQASESSEPVRGGAVRMNSASEPASDNSLLRWMSGVFTLFLPRTYVYNVTMDFITYLRFKQSQRRESTQGNTSSRTQQRQYPSSSSRVAQGSLLPANPLEEILREAEALELQETRHLVLLTHNLEVIEEAQIISAKLAARSCAITVNAVPAQVGDSQVALEPMMQSLWSENSPASTSNSQRSPSKHRSFCHFFAVLAQRMREKSLSEYSSEETTAKGSLSHAGEIATEAIQTWCVPRQSIQSAQSDLYLNCRHLINHYSGIEN